MGLIFSRATKSQKQAIAESNSRMRSSFFRFPLFIALAIVMYHLYSTHFTKRFAQIESRSAIVDRTGMWSKSERDAIKERAAAFRRDWGIQVYITVQEDGLATPSGSNSALFIGLVPAQDEVILRLPPLAASAVQAASQKQGVDVQMQMENDLRLCAQEYTSTAPCLAQTLDHLNRIFSNP